MNSNRVFHIPTINCTTTNQMESTTDVLVSRVESILLVEGCLQEGSVDKAVLEYIVDVLQETEDVDEVRDVLEPMIEDLGCEGDGVVSVVEALVAAKDAWEGLSKPLEQNTVVVTRDEPVEEDDDQGGEEEAIPLCMTEDEVRAVGMLASLLSLDDAEESQRGYLLDMYKSCRSNMDAAADVLLGKTGLEIQNEIEARERRRGRENTPPTVDPEVKASIVSKYHLQAVSSDTRGTSSTRQRKKENEFMMKGFFAGDGGKKSSAVRFRDGAVVTTKGEKYITEKKEEWDGGSRGRVKSKGKRGVGWV